jgi:hypothetical protein
MKSVFIIIAIVAIIGVMVPNVFAGHNTSEEALDCKSDIMDSIYQELKYPVDLDFVKNNVFETATDCVKDRLHQITDSCNTVDNEIQILKSIKALRELGKTEHIADKLAKLEISKWTCSEDRLDIEFRITAKFNKAQAEYDYQKSMLELQYQKDIDYNKGRLTWVTDCSEKGIVTIHNIKEYGDDGITLKKIDSYNYQILDSMSNPIINEIDHTGEISLLHQEYPKAKYVQMSGEKGLDERRSICSNYFAIDFFDIELICPTSDEYYVVENYSSDEIKYSFDLKDNATFGFQNNKDLLRGINVEAHYFDGQIVSNHSNSFSVPIKNENSMISHVVLTDEDHHPQEIQYSCEITPFIEKTLVTLHQNEKFAEAEAIKAAEKAEETRNYCNDEIDGCKITYNLRYEIDAPNDFIYKSWMGDGAIDDIENISYTFTKSSKFSFFLREDTKMRNGGGNIYDTATEKFEFGSMFIPSKAPITNLISGEGYKIERKNMNFAGGITRDVIHVEYIESLKTLSGFIDYDTNWYYDWGTGLLLKHEVQRTLLDVAGVTNHDKMIQEVSKVNFPKNNSNGGGCLIATAAYGSELSPQVQLLREIRDNQLMNTESGSAFMGMFNDVYYSFSPIIADMERESPMFKEITKLGLTPMLSSLEIMENAESESEVLGYGISLIILNLGMYLGVPAIVVIGIKKRF